MSLALPYTIVNQGTKDDSYVLKPTANVNWTDFSGVPATMTLPSKASAKVTFTVHVPKDEPTGTIGRFSIEAFHQGYGTPLDQGIAEITVIAPPSGAKP